MGKKILIAIVDDHESVRVAIGSLVRSLGYQSSLYSSADEFLQTANFEPIDCIITDWQMAGTNGLELLHKMRNLAPLTPCILVTAFFEKSIQEKALAGGAIAVLSKPFSAEQMISSIKKALDNAK